MVDRLEQLVNEIKPIKACLKDVIENSMDSYASRTNLDAILHPEFPIETAAATYLNNDQVPMLNDLTRQSIDRRKNEMKYLVTNDLKKYLLKLDENILKDVAYNTDDKYKKVISAIGDGGKMTKIIQEYTGDNARLCFDLIKTSRDPNAFEKTYKMVMDAEQKAINEREGFVDEDGKTDKLAVHGYIAKKIQTSEDAEKDIIYSNIVEGYLK